MHILNQILQVNSEEGRLMYFADKEGDVMVPMLLVVEEGILNSGMKVPMDQTNKLRTSHDGPKSN